MSIYTENGYDDRDDYFMSLSSEYGVDIYLIEKLSLDFGEKEEFDLLPKILELERFPSKSTKEVP